MRSGTATGSRATAAEPSSPELALVDRELAALARARLAPPDDTIERLERAVALRRLTALADRGAEVDGQPRARSRALRPRATRRTVAASVAATLVVALLLGVQVDLRGNPAGADPLFETETVETAPATPPKPVGVDSLSTPTAESPPTRAGTHESNGAPGSTSGQKQTSRPAKPSTQAREPAPRRFAWAPVAGATAYHVEFFRESMRVYASRTTDTQLDLPRSWTFRGRAQRLSPGTYRWYVWPIRSGRRETTATVQAELVVD